jgi:hypothetical protein
MPMNPRLLRPTASGATHPEARDWATRVTANGGTVSSTTLGAVSKFCAAIDAAGVRGRFLRLNLFCGTSDASLNAVRTPLYRGQSLAGSQLGNATDTNVNFVQGDYAETGSNGGLKGNGSNKHLLTGLLGTEVAFDNSHLSCYGKEFNSGASFAFPIGVRITSGAGRNEIFTRNNSVLTNRYYSTSNSAISAASIGDPAINAGHILGTAVADNDNRFFANGAQSGINTTVAVSTTFSAFEYSIFGANTGGTVGGHVASYLSAYSIGIGMTATQAAAFYAALHAFQTTLGRQQ